MNSSHNAGFQSDVCSGSLQESTAHNGHSLHLFRPGTILREQSLQPRLRAFTHQTCNLHSTSGHQEMVISNTGRISNKRNLIFSRHPNKQVYFSFRNILHTFAVFQMEQHSRVALQFPLSSLTAARFKQLSPPANFPSGAACLALSSSLSYRSTYDFPVTSCLPVGFILPTVCTPVTALFGH